MKKTYTTPKTKTVELPTASILALSDGLNEGQADGRSYSASDGNQYDNEF